MLLNFFVQGQPHNAAAASSSSSTSAPHDQSTLITAAWERTKASASALSDMSPDEMLENTQRYAQEKWESSKKLFRFLSGDPVPSSQPPPPLAVEPKQEHRPAGWRQGLTGLFAGLRPSGGDVVGPVANVPEEGFTDGEVHADLVMVCCLVYTYFFAHMFLVFLLLSSSARFLGLTAPILERSWPIRVPVPTGRHPWYAFLTRRCWRSVF